jgi:hypothetical protein
LGHASDTTLARASAGEVTVESKPVVLHRTGTVTDSATPYPSSDGTTNGTKVNYFTVTALAQAAEVQIPKGTWVAGEELAIAITGDATPRALTWVTSAGGFKAGDTTPGALPTTTVASKTIVIKTIYDGSYHKYVGYAGAF